MRLHHSYAIVKVLRPFSKHPVVFLFLTGPNCLSPYSEEHLAPVKFGSRDITARLIAGPDNNYCALRMTFILLFLPFIAVLQIA